MLFLLKVHFESYIYLRIAGKQKKDRFLCPGGVTSLLEIRDANMSGYQLHKQSAAKS